MLGKKSKLVNSSPPTEGISNMTILSNNNSVQERRLVPDYMGALKDLSQVRYYVIYKGPHKGIHTEWGAVEAFSKADKTTSRKFKSEASARLSLAAYEDEMSSKKPLLRPKIQRAKEDHRDQRFVIPREIAKEFEAVPIDLGKFWELWCKARAACQEDFIAEKFYTTDKKSKSLYNFVEGADPYLVHMAFKAGLVHNIYPNSNLQEIKCFPAPMIDAIKNFCKKVLKAKDEPLYINVISSVLDWQHEERHNPYYFMEIGLAKSKKEMVVSQPMEDKVLPFTEILHPVWINGLRRIAEKVLEALTAEGSKKK